MEHISRLNGMLMKIAYTTSESKMLGPLAKNWRFLIQGQLSQCFSCLHFLSLESDCKSTHFFSFSQKKFVTRLRKEWFSFAEPYRFEGAD